MTYRVTILRRAWHDVLATETDIAARSEQGAESWVKSFDKALASLKKDPLREPIAPDSEGRPEETRNIMFRTRKGRTYRAIILVESDEVRVLHVRGPGQDTLGADDIEIQDS